MATQRKLIEHTSVYLRFLDVLYLESAVEDLRRFRDIGKSDVPHVLDVYFVVRVKQVGPRIRCVLEAIRSGSSVWRFPSIFASARLAQVRD